MKVPWSECLPTDGAGRPLAAVAGGGGEGGGQARRTEQVATEGREDGGAGLGEGQQVLETHRATQREVSGCGGGGSQGRGGRQ